MFLLYLLFGVSYVLKPISSIPLTDLDSEGYPTDFEVSGYACEGHFWFQSQWVNGQRKYIMDPPMAPNGDRWIFWTNQTGDSKWQCYKPQNGYYWTSCSDTNLFNCNSGIIVRYTITATQSGGWYQQLATDDDGFNVYQRETTPFRIIAYDKKNAIWLVSDEDMIYDACYSVNFFECSWVQTGQTYHPTSSPTLFSLAPSVAPTHVSFSPSESPSKLLTQTTHVPTHAPTDITTPPTRKPSLHAEIPSKTSTKSPSPKPSYSLAIASTNTLTQTVDVDVDNRDGIRTILLVFINAMICILCVCALYLATAIYKHKTNNKAAMDGDPGADVKASSLIINARPVIQLQLMERDRVASHSLYMDDENAVKVNDDVVQVSDVMSEEQKGEKVQVTDPGIQIDERMKIRQEKQREQLEQWLTGTVKLPKYYQMFVQNGYDSLAIVKEVTDVNELAQIGIELKGHKVKIMKEIERLVLVEDFVD
eukprot:296411_1